MIIHSKLPDVGITIFTIMSKLAAEHQAVNLSQGFPDFDPHPELVERVSEAMRAGLNQYAPMQGVPELRRQIARKTNELYGNTIDPETEVTVTSGATEALFAAITAVVHAGDEVVVIEPAFDSYVPAIALNRAVPVFVPMTFPEYTIDWNRVASAITRRTRLIVLNSPHNPTGTALTGEDIKALREITSDTDILVISDEVYEHIIFDGLPHESMARHPELAGRTFVISSFGKTYHATGWKTGYCLAPPPLTEAFRKIHQFVTFAVNTPVQNAYAEFARDASTYLPLSDFYQKKRDLFLSMLETSRFRPVACRGTYFQMLDYSRITDESDTDFARRLTSEYGVAAIPPSVFYHDKQDHKVLRFCFAKRDDTLREAAKRLCRI